MFLSVLWIDAAAPVRKQTCVEGELTPVSLAEALTGTISCKYSGIQVWGPEITAENTSFGYCFSYIESPQGNMICIYNTASSAFSN